MDAVKRDLALAYRIAHLLNLDDHTYTHLSARSPHGFYVYPFGYLFEEVTEECLLEVTLAGKILQDNHLPYNPTATVIHSGLYKARPDIQAVFHLHTPAIVAVASMEKGVLPISQWALHFYGRIHYHDYDSLALTEDQGLGLGEDLGDKPILMLRNHGVVICAATIQEAMFYAYHLEKACRTQCLALGLNQPLIIPSHETCQRACQDLHSFEDDFGMRDWQAWVRKLLPIKENS